MPGQRISLVLLAVALLAQPLALAQATILPSTLPTCATSCTILQQAQGSCMSNPAAAGSCLCQSTLLSGLKSSGAAICPNCPAADQSTISSWYNSFCANGGVSTTSAANAGGVVTVTSTSTPAGNTATESTATSTASSSSDSSDSSEDINQNSHGSAWWKSHWQWVLMVIILALGFGIIGIGGAILYKRRKRRRDGELEPRPEMSTWAPSQHNVHDFGNPNSNPNSNPNPNPSYAPGGHTASAPPRGKGKGRDVDRAAPTGERNGKASNKVKKVLGRT